MLKKAIRHYPLGCPLRVRIGVAEDFSCRPDVVLGSGKQPRLLHCYVEEEEVREGRVRPSGYTAGGRHPSRRPLLHNDDERTSWRDTARLLDWTSRLYGTL